MTTDNPIFVSFYTEAYAQRAGLLVNSLDSLALQHDIRPMRDRGSRKANIDRKAGHVASMCERYKDRPVVWIDADAIVHIKPDLFFGAQEDFMCYRLKIPKSDAWNHSSATVYIGATKTGRKIAKCWERYQTDHPAVWDDDALQMAWKQCQDYTVVRWLPPSYRWDTREFPKQFPDSDIVIEHPPNPMEGK